MCSCLGVSVRTNIFACTRLYSRAQMIILICDRSWENWPSLHMVMIVENLVLQFLIAAFTHVGPTMNWSQQSIDFIIVYSLKFVTCLISGHFRSFFEGAHQFWASAAKGVGRWETEGEGWGGRWQKLVKSVQSSSTAKTRSPEQSIVSHEDQ